MHHTLNQFHRKRSWLAIQTKCLMSIHQHREALCTQLHQEVGFFRFFYIFFIFFMWFHVLPLFRFFIVFPLFFNFSTFFLLCFNICISFDRASTRSIAFIFIISTINMASNQIILHLLTCWHAKLNCCRKFFFRSEAHFYHFNECSPLLMTSMKSRR